MPLVTVTTRAGKTPAWKRAVLDGIHRAGETQWENWSFAGGRQIHA